MKQPIRCVSPEAGRRGAVLIAVLMGALIVSTLALAALATARNHVKHSEAENLISLARANTISLLDWATASINATEDWRDALDGATVESEFEFPGRMRGSFRVVDSDGRLTDSSRDPCDLIATLTSGDFSYTVKAQLVPAGEPLACMKYAVCAADSIEFEGVVNVVGGMFGDSIESEVTLTADCDLTDYFDGIVFGATNKVSRMPRIPADRTMEHYMKLATRIPASSLPSSFGDRLMHNQVLTPGVNTISGKVNRLGIYAIDCGGDGISIARCRIEGTLIVYNMERSCELIDSNYIIAASPNFATLIVDGKLVLGLSDEPLDESEENINLNPPGAPYRGVEDMLSNTAYPSMVGGLIFCSDDIDLGGISRRSHVRGQIITRDDLRGEGALFVEPTPSALVGEHPPLGFADYSRVRVLPGSVERQAGTLH